MTVPAQIANPFVQIFSLNGQGLNNGNVYIGAANLDPVTNPQAVYWDQALTVPATQPLSVVGGYIMRLGAPATAYTAGLYSLKVTDHLGVQVFYCPQVPIDNFGLINVMWYGATGDGVTDDTTAITNAFAAVPATGGRVYFPAGKYIVSSTITVSKETLIYGDGGANNGASQVLTSSATGDIFNFTVAGSVVEDLYIGAKAGVVRTVNQISVHISGGGGSAQCLKMSRCTIDNAATGILFNSGGDGWLWLNTVEVDVLGGGVGKAIVMQGSSVPMFDGVVVATIGLPYPTGQAASGFDLSECSYGFLSNCTALCTGSGVNILPGGTVSSSGNLYFTNVGCDHCNTGWNFVANTGYAITNIFMAQCSGTSSSVDGMTLNAAGAGQVSQIAISGGTWALNADNGVTVSGGTNFVSISAGTVFLRNTGADLAMTGSANHVTVAASQFGNASFPSGYGVLIANTVDYVGVSGCLFASAFTTAPVVNGSAGAHIAFSGNTGLVTTGTSAITPGASPYTYTAGFSPEVIYVSGGTVSNITVDAVSTGLTSGAFTLRSKGALVVTYTVAPTMNKTVLG